MLAPFNARISPLINIFNKWMAIGSINAKITCMNMSALKLMGAISSRSSTCKS